MTTVDSILRPLLDSRSLAYSCGQQIWCPGCDGILDVRTSVEITLPSRGVTVFCGDCWGRKTLALAQKGGDVAYFASQAILDGHAMDHPDFDAPATRAPGWWIPVRVEISREERGVLLDHHAGPDSPCYRLAYSGGAWMPRNTVLDAARDLRCAPAPAAWALADRFLSVLRTA